MAGTADPPAAREQADRDEWIAVGAVRGAFGVGGALKVEPYSDIESTVLNQARKWRMGISAQAGAPSSRAGGGLPFPLPADVAVTGTRIHGGFVIATIDRPVSREQALALKGTEVLVQRRDFPPPDADEYYWADLIACEVVDPTGRLLGTVEGLDDHGAQSVLRLDNGILIPFVAAFILEVAPARKRIVTDWSADWL